MANGLRSENAEVTNTSIKCATQFVQKNKRLFCTVHDKYQVFASVQTSYLCFPVMVKWEVIDTNKSKRWARNSWGQTENVETAQKVQMESDLESWRYRAGDIML